MDTPIYFGENYAEYVDMTDGDFVFRPPVHAAYQSDTRHRRGADIVAAFSETRPTSW